jgi:hypothetical protein
MRGKVFRFKIPEGIMVLVPEAGKLFLVEETMADSLPDEVECEPIYQQDRGGVNKYVLGAYRKLQFALCLLL